MLQAYPGFTVVGLVTILLIAIFFITGADTGAVVLGMLSSHGIPNPRHTVSAIWGASSAAVAIVLLYVGGLDAIQTFVILAASPFILVMIMMTLAFYKDLRRDPLRQQVNPPVRAHAPSLGNEVGMRGRQSDDSTDAENSTVEEGTSTTGRSSG